MEATVETAPVVKLTPFQEWAAIPDTEQQISSETEIDTASETAPASEPDAHVAETTEEKDEKELPKGLKKRFRDLTTEIRELRAQLANKPAAGEEPGIATLPKTETKADQAGKPVAANFTTYEEYVEALTDWKLEQRDALRKQADAQDSQRATVQAQVTAARARHDDYDQVVNDQVSITPAMAEVMVSSENGAEIAYFLGSHPDEAARISKLSPAAAGLALGKIEASLNLESSAAQPKPKVAQTKAPAPPKIINGTGGGADPEPDPKNYVAWEKWYNRELKRRSTDD